MSEYTHNDDVADLVSELLVAKEEQLALLQLKVDTLQIRIDKYRNSINALSLSIDEDYANGF